MGEKVLLGGCLCGAIRFEAHGESSRVANCHCSLCRKDSGAAFLTYAAYAKNQLHFTKGALVHYRSSKEALRGHCANCCSTLTFSYDSDPETIWMTAGSFDAPGQIRPTENWFVADKVEWVTLDANLPQWEGAPD